MQLEITPDIISKMLRFDVGIIRRVKVRGTIDKVYDGITCTSSPGLLSDLIVNYRVIKEPKFCTNLLNPDNTINNCGVIAFLCKKSWGDDRFKKEIEKELINYGFKKVVEYGHPKFRYIDDEGIYDFRWKD